METVPMATIITLVGLVATISGIVLGWTGKARTVRQDTAAEAREDATIKTSLDYIKHGVDDLRIEVKSHGKRFDEMSDRLARVEESTKSAHKRIDRLEVE